MMEDSEVLGLELVRASVPLKHESLLAPYYGFLDRIAQDLNAFKC